MGKRSIWYKKSIVIDLHVVMEESFEKWMNTLDYAEGTVRVSVHYVRDFFLYLKSVGIAHLEDVKSEVITGYYEYLKMRKNKRQSGALSQNYITSNINAIKRFNRYLEQTGKGQLEITLKTPVDKHTLKTILTQKEIRALYEVTDNTPDGYPG